MVATPRRRDTCAGIQQRQTSGFTREAAGREPWGARNPLLAPPPVAPPPKTEAFGGEAAVGSFKTGPCELSSKTPGDHSRPVSRGGPQPCRPRRPRLGPCVTAGDADSKQARPTRATRLPPTSPRGVRFAGTLPCSDARGHTADLWRCLSMSCRLSNRGTGKLFPPPDVDVQQQSQWPSQKRILSCN